MTRRSHTARWRSSKTRQKRIQFRQTPRVFAPPEYLRDLRDPVVDANFCFSPSRRLAMHLQMNANENSYVRKSGNCRDNGFPLLRDVSARTNATSPEECMQACTRLPNCTSASWHVPGSVEAYERTSQCWLSGSCVQPDCCDNVFVTFVKDNSSAASSSAPPVSTVLLETCTCGYLFKPCCGGSDDSSSRATTAGKGHNGSLPLRERERFTQLGYPSQHEVLRRKLRRHLAGKRVVFVGDSTMRQFYETLACFLHLQPAAPRYYARAEKTGIKSLQNMPEALSEAIGNRPDVLPAAYMAAAYL